MAKNAFSSLANLMMLYRIFYLTLCAILFASPINSGFFTVAKTSNSYVDLPPTFPRGFVSNAGHYSTVLNKRAQLKYNKPNFNKHFRHLAFQPEANSIFINEYEVPSSELMLQRAKNLLLNYPKNPKYSATSQSIPVIRSNYRLGAENASSSLKYKDEVDPRDVSSNGFTVSNDVSGTNNERINTSKKSLASFLFAPPVTPPHTTSSIGNLKRFSNFAPDPMLFSRDKTRVSLALPQQHHSLNMRFSSPEAHPAAADANVNSKYFPISTDLNSETESHSQYTGVSAASLAEIQQIVDAVMSMIGDVSQRQRIRQDLQNQLEEQRLHPAWYQPPQQSHVQKNSPSPAPSADTISNLIENLHSQIYSKFPSHAFFFGDSSKSTSDSATKLVNSTTPHSISLVDLADYITFPKDQFINFLIMHMPAILNQLGIHPEALNTPLPEYLEAIAISYLPVMDDFEKMHSIVKEIEIPILPFPPTASDWSVWWESIKYQLVEIATAMRKAELPLSSGVENAANVSSVLPFFNFDFISSITDSLFHVVKPIFMQSSNHNYLRGFQSIPPNYKI